eukprot:16439645-Heterocapsa_arctica.AAC.1
MIDNAWLTPPTSSELRPEVPRPAAGTAQTNCYAVRRRVRVLAREQLPGWCRCSYYRPFDVPLNP